MKLSALIAGGGPVGLMLAGELARWGVPYRVFDQATERTTLSKALVVWPRTLEMLRLAGCADTFVKAGRAISRAEISSGRRKIATIGFESIAGFGTPYPCPLFVPQSETERLLEEHLSLLGGRVERGVTLASFAARANGVSVTLAHPDGRKENVECDWLLGCDGAHSAVRHGLGIGFEGATEPFAFMLGDVKLSGAAEDRLSLYWHSSGVLGLFPMGGGRFRVIADLGPAETAPAAATLDLIQHALDQRGPGGMNASDPAWLSLFHINDRKVKDYRHGHVILAGDAAHIHSPAGGQGMNTGMQDASNLAWKLALVARGAPERLLDTYSAERSAVGRMVLRNAGGGTRLVTVRNKLLQAVRNFVVAWLLRQNFARRAFAATMTELNIGYPKSALSQGAKRGRIAPGMRAPDADLAGGGTLFDALNRRGFTVLNVGGAAPSGGFARFGDLVKVVTAANAGEIAARWGDGLYVVRPDWYVGLVAKAGEWSAAEKYLAAWTDGVDR